MLVALMFRTDGLFLVLHGVKLNRTIFLAFSACLRETLNGIKPPDVDLSCKNVHFKDKSHLSALKDYVDAISIIYLF